MRLKLVTGSGDVVLDVEASYMMCQKAAEYAVISGQIDIDMLVGHRKERWDDEPIDPTSHPVENYWWSGLRGHEDCFCGLEYDES